MKIGIAGAFSSGKTTLAKEVSSYLPDYKLDINSERELADTLWFDFNNHTQVEKEKYQRYLLQKSTQTATENENLITDTPLQVLLWYSENQQLRLLTQQAMINLYDVLIFLPHELDIKDDGVRNINKQYQEEVDDLIKNACLLTYRKNKNMILERITWDFNERLVDTMKVIENFKKGNIKRWFNITEYKESFNF